MEWVLVAAALACDPGDRLVDLSTRLWRGVGFIDLLVTVEPFYSRLYVYQPGFRDSTQSCCSNRRSSVLHLHVIDGRFCIRQSQPQMKWKLQLISKPEATT